MTDSMWDGIILDTEFDDWFRIEVPAGTFYDLKSDSSFNTITSIKEEIVDWARNMNIDTSGIVHQFRDYRFDRVARIWFKDREAAMKFKLAWVGV